MSRKTFKHNRSIFLYRVIILSDNYQLSLAGGSLIIFYMTH